MKLKKTEIKELITLLGFKQQDGEKDIYYKTYKKHKDYILKVNFEKENIEYGTKIKLGDLTTSNFENSENFVVLECVDRVLEKGYSPDRLSLEHKWPMGRKEKGKLDILITDKDDKAYLMIECKTWGGEYENEKKKMQRDGGQLFSYFQQDKAAQYLCLYASRLNKVTIEFVNDIVQVDEQWKELSNQKEIFDHWNKNFKDNGIFEEWANAYDIEIKALTRGRLKELTEEDSGRIFNQFAEILRHNVVSDKPNAFNKIFNLFLCKIVDEDRKPDEELKFQWLETDNDEDLQKRLSDLYKQGMKEYLTKDVTDYNDKEVEDKLYALDAAVRDQIREMFTKVRLHKNNEFAFKEVFDEKSFRENAIVVREVVELLQPYQIRYGHKQQFLGDFFELLLSTGIKQEAGQFFTPVPVAKFIISSLPIRELIEKKIQNDETNFLPYIIDYAAGSGHFLTEAMDEVQNIIESIDPSKQKPSVKAKLKSWKESSFDWAYDYVYGVEADYRLVKTAKVSCFLNGDGLANVIHADGLDHFQKSIDYKGKLKEVSADDTKDNGQFDILVANPPYSVSAFKNTLKNGEESFELFNRLTDDSSEIECLFIERTKQLLKPGGWAGVILPSSILNNSGIYTDAREIILKYFHLKAIAEFGSNTFMATGTNTVTLFLERKPNNDWKKIETAIKNFFDKPKEATVNGIEKAFSKYVSTVFEDLELTDYISLISKKPNETIQKQELYNDYKTWFASLTEVKQLKEKKAFKDKTKAEQQAELDKLFFDKVFAKEQDKMLYYFLVYPQQTVLIKVGEKQAEKDFIGYEFSSRRGHEGIKMYRDENGKPTTKLYDDDNHLNPAKANSYVYRSYLGQKYTIEKTLTENISTFETLELMDFSKLAFEKSVSISIKKKVKIQSKFPLVPLSSLTTGFTGVVFDKTDESQTETDLKILTASNIDLASKSVVFEKSKSLKKSVSLNPKEQLKKGDIFICTSSGSLNHLGKFAFIENDLPYWAGGFCAILRSNDFTIQKYIAIILGNLPEYRNFVEGFSGQNINNLKLSDLWQFKIPSPPKPIQDKIIKEISAVEQREKGNREKVDKLKQQIEVEFDKLTSNSNEVLLSKIISLQNGKGLPTSKMVKGEHLVYGGNGINGTHNAFVSEKSTIAIGRVGAYCGAVHLTEPKSWITDNSMFINEFLMECNIKFMYLALKKLNLNQFATQSSHPNISQPTVLSKKISFPDIKEQNKIIEKIEKIEAEIKAIEADLANIDNEKEQILKKHLE
jgi:type I restriction enzyme M protein